MTSARLPSNLLHGNMEPQWFPRHREETESSLEVIEKQEEEYLESLREMVLPTPPEPLGFGTGSNSAKQRSMQQQKVADLRAIPPGPRFWEKYKNPKLAKPAEPQESDSSVTGEVESNIEEIIPPPSPSVESEMDLSRDSSTVLSPPRYG